MGREASALLRSFVYEYLGACDYERGLIEVKVPKEVRTHETKGLVGFWSTRGG